MDQVIFGAARKAQCTIPCHHCGTAVEARRSCHEAYIHCTKCAQDYPLKEYISEMDEPLEGFLEKLYLDRI